MSYQSHGPDDRAAMLARIGVDRLDDLFADLPASLRNPPLEVPPGLTEPELLRLAGRLAARNSAADLICFLGAGAYDHYIPAAVGELAGRAEFYTGYTPYQPEMTQGMLQAIYEYQTMICELTGLDVSNASLYDGASAVWEALLMSERHVHQGRFLVSRSVSPLVRATLRAYASAADFPVAEVGDPLGALDPARLEAELAAGASALVVALPTAYGELHDATALAELCHRHRALLVVIANPLALALVKTPAEMGADICVGDGQPLGIPLQFGGPFLGFLATTNALVRKMPGRIVGATVDADGQRGFVLTLQAREQHIRREKATSNVCTNQALMALRATIYLTLLGRQGLRELATVNLQHAGWLRRRLLALPGVSALGEGPHFHEFAIRVPDARGWHQAALQAGYLAGLPLAEWEPELADGLLLCATEQRTRAELEGLVAVWEELA
ncbi:MAG: aminomethyl-transferring glycine dehydrogenase subunit GcvPA [Fimbriimonadaceae bacterium]|nr:aminomethyl-transferring glycine dehydrogenase subunit GcvPA [Fimbriimonadaceae bacterium]